MLYKGIFVDFVRLVQTDFTKARSYVCVHSRQLNDTWVLCGRGDCEWKHASACA